jgi:hypothetical protein
VSLPGSGLLWLHIIRLIVLPRHEHYPSAELKVKCDARWGEPGLIQSNHADVGFEVSEWSGSHGR